MSRTVVAHSGFPGKEFSKEFKKATEKVKRQAQINFVALNSIAPDCSIKGNTVKTSSVARAPQLVGLAISISLLVAVRMAYADPPSSVESIVAVSKRIETRNVMRSVENALVQWQTEQEKPCPSALAEMVARKILYKEPKDGWARALEFKCPGVHGGDIDLVSAGQDGKFGTSDDIRSWEDAPTHSVTVRLTEGQLSDLELYRMMAGIDSRSEAIVQLFVAGLRAKAQEIRAKP